MPRRPEFQEAAEEWLHFAEGDLLAAAHSTGLELYLEILCFHSQQCAEKSIKAVLVAEGCDVPFTHDIALLMDRLESAGIPSPACLKSIGRLSVFAVATRYPGSVPAPDKGEYLASLAVAQQCPEWAKSWVFLGPLPAKNPE
jgi:HEPN domain-containing protein